MRKWKVRRETEGSERRIGEDSRQGRDDKKEESEEGVVQRDWR